MNDQKLKPEEIVYALDIDDACEVHGNDQRSGRVTRQGRGFVCRFADGESFTGSAEAVCDRINRRLGLTDAS